MHKEMYQIYAKLAPQGLSTFFSDNHNYNKIVKSDWLSTALISALIGQYALSRARLNGFFFHC